ncbi:kinase-like domain-containing protein, partial [Amylostereum chailletii]
MSPVTYLFHFRLPGRQVYRGIEIINTPISPWATSHAETNKTMNDTVKAISDSRTRLVDFGALKNAVEEHMKEGCVSMEWVVEGGANQIYLVQLESGRNILARLSFSYPYAANFGEQFKIQEEYDRERLPARALGEVAAILYVKQNTNVPVAAIYGYNLSPKNPVGTTYILQERIKGDVLSQRWFTMSFEQRSRAVASFTDHLGQILSLRFSAFGSLVLEDGEIVVGRQIPHLDTLSRYYPVTDSGPWPADQPLAFLEARAIREYLWLNSHGGHQLFTTHRNESYPSEDQSKTLPAFIDFSYRILRLVQDAHTLYPLPNHLHRPTLMHGDLHFTNVLVSQDDPGVVSGIVEWEHSSVVPLWVAYNVPGMILDTPYTPEERKADNGKLRAVFWEKLSAACPDLDSVIHPRD